MSSEFVEELVRASDIETRLAVGMDERACVSVAFDVLEQAPNDGDEALEIRLVGRCEPSPQAHLQGAEVPESADDEALDERCACAHGTRVHGDSFRCDVGGTAQSIEPKRESCTTFVRAGTTSGATKDSSATGTGALNGRTFGGRGSGSRSAWRSRAGTTWGRRWMRRAISSWTSPVTRFRISATSSNRAFPSIAWRIACAFCVRISCMSWSIVSRERR